jgi:hypothetical protein
VLLKLANGTTGDYVAISHLPHLSASELGGSQEVITSAAQVHEHSGTSSTSLTPAELKPYVEKQSGIAEGQVNQNLLGQS